MNQKTRHKILLSVFSDVTTDQRVLKTIDTLRRFGYTIVVAGRKLSGSLPVDLPVEIHRFKVIFQKGFLAYAEWNIRLFFYLMRNKADVLLANDLDTLPANYIISKIKNLPLIYDTHEIFPEVPELVSRPRVKRFWEWIERMIFPHLQYVYTVSGEVAAYYSERYAVPVQVVRNVPLLERRQEEYRLPDGLHDYKIVLYQGALNQGRGLELAIEAMPYLEEWVLVVAGDGPLLFDLQNLAEKTGVKDRVYFTGRLLPARLAGLTVLADIGLSIEEDLGLNYRYALPNKIFDYIHARVPVLVSDLPEMKNLISRYHTGKVLRKRTPRSLANAIETLYQNPVDDRYFNKAIQELNWEKESEILIGILDQALFNSGKL